MYDFGDFSGPNLFEVVESMNEAIKKKKWKVLNIETKFCCGRVTLRVWYKK